MTEEALLALILFNYNIMVTKSIVSINNSFFRFAYINTQQQKNNNKYN